MQKVIADTSIPKHRAEISFLHKLLYDMKKMFYGLQTDESITAERIDAAYRMLSRLEECRQEVEFKH